MEAFITGSQAYGTATDKSDIDLCILVDDATKAEMVKHFGMPIRCGKLNIIACTSEPQMLAWKKAKEVCVAAATSGLLERNHAVAIHQAWFRQFDVERFLTDPSGVTPDIAAEIAEAKQEARERRALNFDRTGQYR